MYVCVCIYIYVYVNVDIRVCVCVQCCNLGRTSLSMSGVWRNKCDSIPKKAFSGPEQNTYWSTSGAPVSTALVPRGGNGLPSVSLAKRC